MWLAVLLALIAVPLLELALLIKLSQLIGFWPTVGIVVATAVVGTAVMHRQGIAALGRAMQDMSLGKPPIEPVVDGTFLMFAGLMLLTPGLITDSIGALLLVPPVRRAVAKWGLARLSRSGSIHVRGFETGRGGPDTREKTRDEHARRPGGTAGNPAGSVIEGDFTRIEERTIDPDRGGGRVDEKDRKP